MSIGAARRTDWERPVRRSVGPVLLLIATVASFGCGGQGRGDVTQPTQPPVSPAAYLDALLEIMQTKSINKGTIDWTSFRSQVVAAASDARTIPDLYPAIGVALRLLGDRESYYQPMTGGLIGPAPMGGCSALPPTSLELPDTIAYVKVASCDCQGSVATLFAESIQRAIKTADRAGLVGWIVDLRGNFGGNMWPMIAGVGPVLGEGLIGWIVYDDRAYEREYRDGAALSLGEAFAQVADPYTLLKMYPKVAVLTDGVVASAGEAVVVFFRGRPGTRSFGTPTCGHHHLQEALSLRDGATLFLATSQHADRTKERYGGAIQPDEIIADPGETVNRAIAWLQGGG